MAGTSISRGVIVATRAFAEKAWATGCCCEEEAVNVGWSRADVDDHVADLFLGRPSQSRKTKTTGSGSADRLLAESWQHQAAQCVADVSDIFNPSDVTFNQPQVG